MNTLHVVEYNQAQHQQLFPDEIWVKILSHCGIQDKKAYATFTKISKQISYLVTENLPLWDQQIALGFAQAKPHKIKLLHPCYSQNARFIAEVLAKTALSWRDVDYFRSTDEWTHLIKCMVASSINCMSKNHLKKNLPLCIKTSKEAMAFVRATQQRIKEQLIERFPIEWFDEVSAVELASISPNQLKILVQSSNVNNSSNKWLMMKLVQIKYFFDDNSPLKRAHENLRDDKEIVLKGVKENGRELQFASDRLKNDEEVVLAAVTENGFALQYASDDLRNNLKVVTAAVKGCNEALQYASKELKKNRALILLAISGDNYHNARPLQFVDAELLNNKEFALQFVQANCGAFYYIDPVLQNEEEIVLGALKRDGQLLTSRRFINDVAKPVLSTHFRNNPHCILTALESQPMLFEELTTDEKQNKAYILQAVKHIRRDWLKKIVEHIPAQLLKDKSFVLELVHCHGGALEYVSKELQNDEDVVYAAVSNMSNTVELWLPDTFKHASDTLKNNREFVLKVVAIDGNAFQYVAAHFKKDLEIVLTAIRKNNFAFRYVDSSLQEKREVVLTTAEKGLGLFRNICQKYLYDKEVILKAVKNNPSDLRFVPQELFSDKKFVLELVAVNGLALEFAPASLRKDFEVALTACKQNPKALRFAHISLQRTLRDELATHKLS